MSSALILQRESEIARVIINRPSQRNAIDYAGWLELSRIANDVAQDARIRVVVLEGAGNEAFSAGADIRDFQQHRKDSATAKEYARAFEGAMDAVEAIPVPTVCLIRGFCVGGGCELSLATDIRVSADNGRFGIPVGQLGILAGYAEAQRLVDLVGVGNASRLLLSAWMIDAYEALRIGLVTGVVPLSEIDDHVDQLVSQIVSLSPLSQRGHKKILKTVIRNPGLYGLSSEEMDLPLANFDSEDFHEGRRAFLERRKPEFKGK